MAIVAAETKERAINIAKFIFTLPWVVHYGEPDEVSILPVIYDGPEAELAHFEMGE